MIARQPYLPRFMAGGPGNPLGARAMYLGNTKYRIHGTNAPETIGQRVSSGCIRLTNEDVEDLFSRVSIGAKVVVLPMNGYAPQRGADARGRLRSASASRRTPTTRRGRSPPCRAPVVHEWPTAHRRRVCTDPSRFPKSSRVRVSLDAPRKSARHWTSPRSFR